MKCQDSFSLKKKKKKKYFKSASLVIGTLRVNMEVKRVTFSL